MSGWHGRGTLYGGSKATTSRGIGHGCAGELGGEVTGREMVGAGLAHVGVHFRHGVDPGGERGVSAGSLRRGVEETV
jgi:hypothetical protein